jgi:hypothetical protein
MGPAHPSSGATVKVSIWLTGMAALLFAVLHTYVC